MDGRRVQRSVDLFGGTIPLCDGWWLLRRRATGPVIYDANIKQLYSSITLQQIINKLSYRREDARCLVLLSIFVSR